MDELDSCKGGLVKPENPTPLLCVSVCDGKYELVEGPGGSFYVKRHGQYWRDLTGDKMVYSLASELSELRARLERSAEDKDKYRELVIRHIKVGDTLTHTCCSGCIEEHVYTGINGPWLCGKPTKDTIKFDGSSFDVSDISPLNVTHINRVPVEMVECLVKKRG